MIRPASLLVALPLLFAVPALAQDKEPVRPVTQQDVSAVDVIATPANDLNLRKDAIPQLLIAAQTDPYDRTGLKKCTQISAAVGELDAVLGDDLDLPQDGGEGMSAGRVAQAAVGAFIPFRGLIREISGANSHDRKLATAVQAGIARRAFLKGYGEARGCQYPARSVTAAALAAHAAPQLAEAVVEPKPEPRRRDRKHQRFESKPVVQAVD